MLSRRSDHSQTDIQTGSGWSEPKRQTDRQTGRQTDRDQTHRPNGQTDKPAAMLSRCSDRQSDTQTVVFWGLNKTKQTDKQRQRQTDRQKGFFVFGGHRSG